MSNYNIVENRPELSLEQIEKGMDFSKVKQKAAAGSGSSFYGAMIGGLGVVVLLVSSVLFFSEKNNPVVTENSNSTIPLKENAPENYTIPAEKDTSLLSTSPSMVNIPVIGKENKEGEKEKRIDLIKPVVKKKSKYQFKVNISYEDFPELKAFQNLWFEVSDSTKNFNPASAGVKWTDVDVARIGTTNNYKFIFSNHEKDIEVIAYPVVNEKDYKKAFAKWESMCAN